MEHQTRSSQISFGPTVQQQVNWAVRKSRLLIDGQITELRIHTYPFDDEKGPCFDLDECTAYRSSLQSMPRFTICSIRKGHSQNAVHSSLTVTLLSPSGVLWWSLRHTRQMNTDAWARLSDSTQKYYSLTFSLLYKVNIMHEFILRLAFIYFSLICIWAFSPK